MRHRHRPCLHIGNAWPMDASVDEHTSSYGSDCVDITLSDSVLVMGTRSRVIYHLTEFFKMFLKLLGGEGSSVICDIFLGDDTLFKAILLKFLQGFESFMCVKVSL